jgi:hypothetical protein
VQSPNVSPAEHKFVPEHKHVKPSAHWTELVQESPVRFGKTLMMSLFSLLTMLAPTPAATTLTV